MPIKRFKPEQIVTLLRQIEVEIANGRLLRRPARMPPLRTHCAILHGTRRDAASGLSSSSCFQCFREGAWPAPRLPPLPNNNSM